MVDGPALSRAIGLALAQSTSGPATQPDPTQENRPCAGCPKRHLVLPYVEALGINVLYNRINLMRGDEGARVGLHSWWENMRHGFEWDPNPWLVNQYGHPFQGSNYFTVGRMNGMSFWESSGLAAFGSATWEFFAENNRASLNDFFNTTLGGIALGEVMYRTALNKSTRRSTSITWLAASGVMWQGTNLHKARSTARPFVDVSLLYGDDRGGRSTAPYDAFTVKFSTGGGGKVSQSGIRGRLFGRPFSEGSQHQFSIVQTFDFIVNHAYDFAGQGVEVEFSTTRRLSPATSLWMSVSGGATVLGAVNSLLSPPAGVPIGKGSGFDETRQYDYGPGARWSASAELARSGAVRASITYQGYQIAVVDGTRSNHVLQHVQLDLRQPLVRHLSIGAAGEFFFRKAYFWIGGRRTDSLPQARVFLAWSAR